MVHEDEAPFYEVKSYVCWKCRAERMAAEDAAETNGGRTPAGRYFAAVPKA